jgi:cytochrome P450
MEQSLRLLREPEEFLSDCARRYGDAFTMRAAILPPIVFISDPAAIEQVFAMDRDKDRFRAGEGNYRMLVPLGLSSILNLDGERHTRMRQKLSELWKPQYVEVVQNTVRSTMDRWRRGDRIYLRLEMERIALDVTLSTILGLDESRHREEVRELLVEWFAAADDVPSFVLRFVPLMQQVDDTLYREIARRRRSGRVGPDILSRLARDDDKGRLDDREIRDQLASLVAAGHDTTATIMAWAFFYLLSEPATLARVRDELDSKFHGAPMTCDNYKNPLPRLEAVLDETMRLHQVLSGVNRMLSRATRIGRYTLSKGVIVSPCIYLAHRRPQTWPEPERFLPERFSAAPKPDRSDYFPFGGGVRACIGQTFATAEMKIVVHEVLMRARLRIEQGYQARAIRRGVTYMPAGGIPATVLAA